MVIAAAGRVDEPARERGDAGQPLQEIERRPLGGQHRRRGPAHLGDDVPGSQRAPSSQSLDVKTAPGSSWRNASAATSRPAMTHVALREDDAAGAQHACRPSPRS